MADKPAKTAKAEAYVADAEVDEADVANEATETDEADLADEATDATELGCAFRPEFRFLPVLIFRNSG